MNEARTENHKLIKMNDIVSGSQEIKYALKNVHKIPIEENNRDASWEHLTPQEKKAIEALFR